MSPELQAARLRNGINFTGENDPSKKPDPATVRRPLENINRWYGNVPYTREVESDLEKERLLLRETLRKEGLLRDESDDIEENPISPR